VGLRISAEKTKDHADWQQPRNVSTEC